MRSFLRTIRRFLSELRRRNVYQVAVTYVIVGFFVIEGADLVFPRIDLPPWTVTLVIALVGVGFPIALVIAWAFEVTPEGVRVEKPEGSEEAAQGPEGFSFTSNGVIVGLLVLVAGLFLYPTVFSPQERTEGQVSAPDTAQIDERSIAVLPFEPLSSGEKTETFARGVHDDLLARLSNISDLTVISRTSVERYRDTSLPLPAIADSLGVRWVMEAGVLESGGQIQVRAQLIDPRTDGHVWADDYQRKLTAENLFAIQGDITREIADALKAKLTAGEQSRITGAPTENLQAYRLYMKGRSHLDTRTPEGIRRAVDYFQQALQRDSTFALAWSGLADAQDLRGLYGPDSLRASVPSQEKAARRALKLDPDLAEAHASMGGVYLEQRNAPAALRHLSRSLDLKPSYAQAHHWLGFLLLGIGRPKKGLSHARRAVELNPQQWGANGVLTWAYLANDQTKATLAQVRKLQRMRARQSVHLTHEIRTLRDLDRFEEAHKVAKQTLSEVDTTAQIDVRFELALTEAAMGNTSRASRLLASRQKENAPPFGRGTLYAALAKSNAAFETFENVEKWSLALAVFFRYLYSDALDPLRDDPRYEEIIREINEQWGLNPDGSIPQDAEMTADLKTDA